MCAIALVLPASAAAVEQTVTVPGQANIFGAGHAEAPGGGVLPTSMTFAAGSKHVLTLQQVTGATSAGNVCPSVPADGTCSAAGTNISGAGGLAGFVDSSANQALVGVFATDDEPVDAPLGTLDFSPGSLGHDFTFIAPGIGRPFFVGDGLTGSEAGIRQQVKVPDSATRLYLGFVDGCEWQGEPACYGDNSGELSVTARIGSPTAAKTWDAYEDFALDPDQANPAEDSYGNSGVWSYRAQEPGTYAGDQLLDQFAADYNGIVGTQAWAGPDLIAGVAPGPFVGVNTLTTDIIGSTYIAPANSLLSHPSPSYDGVVRWVSPITGQIRVNGYVWSTDGVGGDGTGWSLRKNGTQIAGGGINQAQPGSFQQGSTPLPNAEVSVAAGDRIELAIDPTGDHLYATTAIGFRIEQAQALPAPSGSRPSAALLNPNADLKPGTKLTYQALGWTGADSVRHEWIRCASRPVGDADAADGCQVIREAGDPSTDRYTVAEADVARYVGVRSVASSAAGSRVRDSSLLGKVMSSVVEPQASAAPKVNGTRVAIGTPLSATAGTWQTGPQFGTLDVARRWERCDASGGCTTVGTGSTYTPKAIDGTYLIRVVERATNSAGQTESASAKVGPVGSAVARKSLKPVIGDPESDAKQKIVTLLGTGTIPQFTTEYAYVKDRDLPNGGKGFEVGDVIGTTPNYVDTPAGNVPVELRVWLGESKTDPRRCNAVRAGLKGMGLDAAIDVLHKAKCEFDDLLIEKGKQPQPVVKEFKGHGSFDMVVKVSDDPNDYDLRVWPTFGALTYGDKYVVNPGFDWKLSAGVSNSFGIVVTDRATRYVTGAKALFEGSDVDLKTRNGLNFDVGVTDAIGHVTYNRKSGFTPRKAGTLDVLVTMTDANGNAIYGYRGIPVIDRPVGQTFESVTHQYYKRVSRDCSAGQCIKQVPEPGSARLRRAGDCNPFWTQILSIWHSLFGGSATGSCSEQVGQAASRKFGLTLIPFLGASGATTTFSTVTHTTDGVYAVGPAGVISSGGANVIASGGANVIASGGGHVIASGGGNVIASGGGNVISSGGGNVVPLPGPNGVISSGGGNVISSGGGNVIASGGGNVIASGGGN